MRPKTAEEFVTKIGVGSYVWFKARMWRCAHLFPNGSLHLEHFSKSGLKTVLISREHLIRALVEDVDCDGVQYRLYSKVISAKEREELLAK